MNIEIIIEGSATSGNAGHRGIPGHQGGSLKKGQIATTTATAPEKTATASKVKNPFKTLEGKIKRRLILINRAVAYINVAALPPGRWFYRLIRNEKGQVAQYLIGVGRTVYAVLNAKGELLGDKRPSATAGEAETGAPPEAAAQSGIDVQTSIQYQLQLLTDEQAQLWAELTGNQILKASDLAANWDDWTPEGLVQLLLVRSEGESNARDGTDD